MSQDPLSFSDEQLDRLADLVAAKVIGMRPAGKPMLTVDDVASRFRVSRTWVYENARRLGAIKIGPGERAPLRFDPDVVAGAMRPAGEETVRSPTQPAENDPRPRRTRPQRLLPVYDG